MGRCRRCPPRTCCPGVSLFARGLGGGFLLVQALAGLSRSGEGVEPYDEAVALFRTRRGHDFSFMWTCTDGMTALELARAASSLGRPDEAREWSEKARGAGSRATVSD